MIITFFKKAMKKKPGDYEIRIGNYKKEPKILKFKNMAKTREKKRYNWLTNQINMKLNSHRK